MDQIAIVMMDRLLATSAQTALLAALVLIIGRFMPRLSPATRCWMWWLVALQAVVGLVVHMELPWLPQASATPIGAVAATWSPANATEAGFVRPSWQTVALLLWSCGLLFMAYFTLRAWHRGRKLVNTAAACTEQRLIDAVKLASRRYGLRKAPKLLLSLQLDSPVLVGPLHPVLLLPAATPLGDDDLEMVLDHELAHLARGDLWLASVPALARHVFFFHPIVHLAANEYDIAREAACDATVVNSASHSRRDYGQLLLRLGTSTGQSGMLMASSTFTGLSKRLTLLQLTAYSSRVASICVLTLVLVGAIPIRLVAAAVAAETAQAQAEVSEAGPTPGHRGAEQAQRADVARQFLIKQVQEYESRLAEAERRLGEFKRKNAPPMPEEIQREMQQLIQDYEQTDSLYKQLLQRLALLAEGSSPTGPALRFKAPPNGVTE